MSQYLKQIPLGTPVEFKHVSGNKKSQYPFHKQYIVMLAGGTGITPMIQALHAILGTPGDTTKVTMLFGNRTQNDILCKDLLDAWAENSKGRFSCTHVLSQEPQGSSWTGPRGYITRELIQRSSAKPSDDVLFMVCGPPPLYNSICGPRHKEEVVGTLADMGFSQEQVYKF